MNTIKETALTELDYAQAQAEQALNYLKECQEKVALVEWTENREYILNNVT